MGARSKRMDKNKPLTIEEAKSSKLSPKYTKRCRYCMQEKANTKFYKSTDFLDTDGKMSVCIDCCSYLFNEYYSVHSRIDIAIYEVCHILNVRYDSGVYSSLMTSLEKNSMSSVVKAIEGESDSIGLETEDEIAVNPNMSVFGKYLSLLRRKYSNKDADLSFDLYSNDRPEGYEDRSSERPVDEIIQSMYAERMDTLDKKWGSGHTPEEVSYLEDEYSGWAKMVDVDDKSVEILVKEICLQTLAIRRKREDGQSVNKQDIDTLTNLMEVCKLSPAKQNEIGSKQNRDCFGVWLKDVETLTPAEWVENQKLFKDVEGIEEYVDRNFGRALKNYIGMQRDFRIVAAKMDEEASDFDSSDVMIREDLGDNGDA